MDRKPNRCKQLGSYFPKKNVYKAPKNEIFIYDTITLKLPTHLVFDDKVAAKIVILFSNLDLKKRVMRNISQP